jgi:galactokinase
LEKQKARYAAAVSEFEALYGVDRDAALYSVAGRSELSGNHTDHNFGCVVAASIDLDIIAVAAPNADRVIRVKSEGFPEDTVDISKLSPSDYENYGSSAIIAGICDGFAKNGFAFGGFSAYTTSNVLKGSGLSSSAAFEVQVCNVLNHFYNEGKIPAPELAKISQYAENVFFGKPSGLMDQTACAVGGFVAIDFENPSSPIIEKLDFSLSDVGYCLCIVNTGGNHADLNDDYASVPAEMRKVAASFGKTVLRGLTYDEILSKLPELRETVGDRALMRALHYVEENKRVEKQKNALKKLDFNTFLDGVLASGDSSFKELQNVFTVKNVHEQGVSLAIALCKHVLNGRGGAWRVHGGGFAGTVQAFVPNSLKDEFKTVLENAFGVGSCSILNIRSEGAIKVK